MSERSGGREQSGPVLQSVFLVVLAHSAIHFPFFTPIYKKNIRCQVFEGTGTPFDKWLWNWLVEYRATRSTVCSHRSLTLVELVGERFISMIRTRQFHIGSTHSKAAPVPSDTIFVADMRPISHRVGRSVGPSARRSVGRSVRWSVTLCYFCIFGNFKGSCPTHHCSYPRQGLSCTLFSLYKNSKSESEPGRS